MNLYLKKEYKDKMKIIFVIFISSSKVFVQKMCEMIDEGKFNIKIATYTNERIRVLVQNT